MGAECALLQTYCTSMESSRAEVSIDVWYGYVTFHTKIVYGGCAAWYSIYVDGQIHGHKAFVALVCLDRPLP